MSTVAARVAAGAAYLDEAAPGWDKQVNLGRLDIAACDRCILGQVYGDDACRFDAALGFDANARPGPVTEAWLASRQREYDDLGAEWRRVIEARRA